MDQLLNIPREYLVTGLIIIVSGAVSLLLLRFIPRSLPGAPDKQARGVTASRLLDRLVTGLLIFLVMWKLSPLLTSLGTVLQEPLALLYLPGGTVGTILGLGGAGLWFAWSIWGAKKTDDEQRPRDIRALGIFLGVFLLGGLPTMRILELAEQGVFSSREQGTGSRVGEEAYDFSLPVLENFSPQALRGEPRESGLGDTPVISAAPDTIEPLGGQIMVSALRGKPVVLNFWATWCPPCRAEFPELVKLQEEYGDRVHILGVNLTSSEASVAGVQEFVDRFSPAFTHGLDTSGSVQARYGVRTVPTTLIIDQTGIITYRRSGAVSRNLLASRLDSLLEAEPQSLPAP